MNEKHMPVDAAEVTICLDTPADVDAEELESLTRQLRNELLELDVQDVAFVRQGQTPVRAKAGDVVNWGTLIITLLASGGVVKSILGLANGWIRNHGQRTITLQVGKNKLTLKGSSSKEEEQLIAGWLNATKNPAEEKRQQ
jgi:hypothetical protein